MGSDMVGEKGWGGENREERRIWKMVGSLAPLAEGLGGTRRFWLRIAAKAANSPNNTARLCLLSNLAV
jgi:hypothetical protein